MAAAALNADLCYVRPEVVGRDYLSCAGALRHILDTRVVVRCRVYYGGVVCDANTEPDLSIRAGCPAGNEEFSDKALAVCEKGICLEACIGVAAFIPP